MGRVSKRGPNCFVYDSEAPPEPPPELPQSHDVRPWQVDIAEVLAVATADEVALVLAFADKLMGEGRSEHGALDLAADSRGPVEFLDEAVDEAVDSISYLLMAARSLRGVGDETREKS